MSQAVIFDNRGLLRLSGDEARPFLQGLVTADLDQLRPDRALYTALLTAQGKFLFDFHVREVDGALLLETAHERLADLERRLMLYRLRAAVTIEQVSPPPALAIVFGEGTTSAAGTQARAGHVEVEEITDDRNGQARRLTLVTDPRLPALGVRVYGDCEELERWLDERGARIVDRAVFDAHRIGLAVPEAPLDLVPEKTIMLEAGLDQLGAVAFDKGCFVGQELTARTHYRGLVKRRLVPVVLDEHAVVEPGFAVMDGEREAGEIRSIAPGMALAMLRLDRLGNRLEAGGGTVRPQPAPWQRDVAARLATARDSAPS